eukprot:gene13129-8975_t
MILTHNNNQNQHHYICLICNHRNLNAGVHNLTLKSKQQTPTSTQKDNNRKANQRSANAMLNPEIEFMPNTRNKSNPNTASPTSCHNLGPTKQQNNLSFQQKITNPTYRGVKQAPRHTQPQPLHLHTSEIEVKHHICPTINTTQTIQFQITTSNQQLRRSNTTNTIGTNGNYAHTKSIQTTTYTHTIIAKPHSRPSCNHIPWESSKPTTVTSQPPTAHATTSSTASASTARVYITNKSKPLGNSRKPSAKFLLKQITQHTNTRPTKQSPSASHPKSKTTPQTQHKSSNRSPPSLHNQSQYDHKMHPTGANINGTALYCKPKLTKLQHKTKYQQTSKYQPQHNPKTQVQQVNQTPSTTHRQYSCHQLQIHHYPQTPQHRLVSSKLHPQITHHHSTTSNRQNQRATKNASKPQKGTHKLTHGNPKPNKFNVPAINSEYGSNRCVSATSYQIRAT